MHASFSLQALSFLGTVNTMSKKHPAQAKSDQNQPPIKGFDPIAFSTAMLEAYDKARPILERSIEKATQKDVMNQNLDPLNVNPIMGKLFEEWINNPDKIIDKQTEYWNKWIDIWHESSMKMLGENAPKMHTTPTSFDRRFKDEDWDNSAIFEFIKKSYLMTCDWVDDTINTTETLNQKDKEKLLFTAKLYTNALSPSNFAITNPQVLKETLNTGGKNLIKGFENLIHDLQRGDGELSISATDYNAFKVGENLAITKGAVIMRNDMMELIQYTPTTQKAHKRPLLIVPPWINKYYILDMRPDNSFIKWAVEQGHSVFTISWVNPDASYANKMFEDYMKDGILAAIDKICDITGELDVNAVGYCLGGTLLAITMAYLAEKRQSNKIASATFLTTLLDFEQAGELKLFLDEEQIEMIDKVMQASGVFEGKNLQHTFKLLRSNDLIWSFVVNNYLMGREPFPFDLLYWNDDSTNMPANMQSFYLKNMYRDNKLAQKGGISIDGVKIDLKSIKTPSYMLSTREDHIAPWKATYQNTNLLGGKTTFTLAASGHIAGVINPPAKEKYCYWSNNLNPKDAEKWLENSSEHAGSWWPHWEDWMKLYTGPKVKAREIKDALESAPGTYVKKTA